MRIAIAVGFLMWPLALTAAPKQLGESPYNVRLRSSSPALISLPLPDGRNAVFGIGDQSLVGLVDGGYAPGFPAEIRSDGGQGRVLFNEAPVACDIDRDGQMELLIAGGDKKLYAMNLDGKRVDGFPLTLPGIPRGPVSCRDKTAWMTVDTGALLKLEGTSFTVVKQVGRGCESGVALASLDLDANSTLIVGGGDARVYALSANGTVRKGFPYRMDFRNSGVPSVGDIDDDGAPDIVFGSQDFQIHAIDRAGKSLPGFPLKTAYRVYASPALGDLDGDGVLDVVVGSGDEKLYALRGTGKSLRGFPKKLKGRVITDAVIGDVDRDGRPEIAVTTETGYLYVVNNRGKSLSGFPFRLGQKSETAPVMVDLNGDGTFEVVAQSQTGTFYVFAFADRGKTARAYAAWPMSGHDAGSSGRYGPHDGRFLGLGFASAEHFTTTPLVAKYTFFDLDGDTEDGTVIKWFVDGTHASQYDGKATIDPRQTRKHQKWGYTLQTRNNAKLYGQDDVASRIYTSPTTKIENTSPEAAVIALGPLDPRTTVPLEVKVTKASKDVDGDEVQYRTIWLKDGKPERTPPTQTILPPEKTKKGEIWQAIVIPYDGETEGTKSVAQLRILNTEPGVPQVTVTPTSPIRSDTIKVAIAQPAPDVDGDKISYRYVYRLGDEILGVPDDLSTLPRDMLFKHQTLTIEVTARDDEAFGKVVTQQLVVQNAVPVAPKIEIWPGKPTTEDDLDLAPMGPAVDDDGDEVVLKHQWLVNGKPVNRGTRIPASETKKGQTWTLQVTPFDGEVSGKMVEVVAVVRNTPPTSPEIHLAKYVYRTTEEIAPQVAQASTDADGDQVVLDYAWKLRTKAKNGQGRVAPVKTTKPKLAPTETRKGQDWELTVTPRDGEANGPSVSVKFTVVNTPPTAPVVAFSDTRPTVRDTVSVSVTTPSSDDDQDVLKYRYRWYVDGRRQDAWPENKSRLLPGDSLKGQHWRVEVVAFDGEDEGPAGITELQVRNHVPLPPVVQVVPQIPKTTGDLKCNVVKPGTDPDKDTLTYRTRWFLDGKLVSHSPSADVLPARRTKAGQKWSCDMQAHDGFLASERAAGKAVTVVNTPPTQPVVQFRPAIADTTRDLVCALAVPSKDDDYDRISYVYRWKKNGRNVSESRNRISAKDTRVSEAWTCSVIAKDTVAAAAPVTVATTIINAKPTRPRVRVEPENARPKTELKCVIVEESTDADGQKITYRYKWYKNGKAQSFASTSSTVPSRLVRAREVWECEVTPFDGKEVGPSRRSVDVRIRPDSRS